jgi:hypothetical protein
MDDYKITVAVCGDSFCSASVNDLGKTNTGLRAHFSQMLEDQFGYRVMYFAHGAFGNTAIWFQIRQAIENKADVVIYNKTWSQRLTLCQRDTFMLEGGLRNFFYYDPSMQSSHSDCVGDQNAPLLSTTDSNIENSPFFSISKEQKTAVDLYLKHLYSDPLQTTIDGWMFEYWHDQIIKAGALPIRFNDPDIGQVAYDFSFANRTFDTPFHTDRATQEQIAKNISRYIVDNLQKTC